MRLSTIIFLSFSISIKFQCNANTVFLLFKILTYFTFFYRSFTLTDGLEYSKQNIQQPVKPSIRHKMKNINTNLYILKII